MEGFEEQSDSNQQLLHDQLVPLKLNESWAGRRLVEALSQLPPSSFGGSLDMRFQQKQIEEREQRRIEMTNGKSTVSETAISGKPVANGRVRQMFDERRRGAGIDRSNPLRPIRAQSRISGSSTLLPSSTIRSSTELTSTTRNQQPVPTRRPINGRRNLPVSGTFERSVTNGHLPRNPRGSQNHDELDDLDNESFPKGFSSLSLYEGKVSTIGDRNNNNNQKKNNEVVSRVRSSNNIKLNPVVTKKSPTIAPSRATPPARQTTPFTSANRPRPTRVTPNLTVKTPLKPNVTKMSIKPPPRIVTPPPGMAMCKFCKRNFLEERLAKHENVCQKMATTRRKIFDASKHRVQGTEAEKYLKKPLSRTSGTHAYASASAHSTTSANPNVKKNNWRKQHEEFIASIRAAKQVTAYLAKGGKLSDLPPPPPSENPDYVQCPHCMRRFNQTAAERHIPKCATMLHNKSKPGAGASKRR